MFNREWNAHGKSTPWFWPESEGNFCTGESNYLFESTLDGDPVVKTFNDFVISRGTSVTTTNRCKGLYLNILGNCIIDRKSINDS